MSGEENLGGVGVALSCSRGIVLWGGGVVKSS